MHVSTTFDPVSKMVTHYVNGRSFSREKIVTAIPLYFGSVYWKLSRILWLNPKEACRAKLMSSFCLRKLLMKMQCGGFLRLGVPTKYQMLLVILLGRKAYF